MSFGSKKSRPQSVSTEKLQSPEQRRAMQALEGPLTTQALSGGFSPTERSGILTRQTEDINRQFEGSVENLFDIFGQAGIRGGVNAADIGNLQESRIREAGRTTSDIEAQSRQAEADRFDRFMHFALGKVGGIGQKQKGFNVGILSG